MPECDAPVDSRRARSPSPPDRLSYPDAEGKLYAHGTTTMMIIPIKGA